MTKGATQLGLFAKFWQPGKVKTRLARSIGDENACQIYQTFLFELLNRLQGCADLTTVVYSPPEKRVEFRNAIAESWSLVRQEDGDLGDRMKGFFEGQFNTDVDKVVIIGADCPTLSAEDIKTSFALLDSSDVVIGPSEDGGYYLLGMKNELIDVFQGITWSTPTVLHDTLNLLETRGVRFALMETKFDVDDQKTLNQLVAILREPSTSVADLRLLNQLELVDRCASNQVSLFQ